MASFKIQRSIELPYHAEEYRWPGWIPSFCNRHAREFYYTHRDITEEHFPTTPRPTLRQGHMVRVGLVQQTSEGRTTSEERVQFLKSSGGILCGLEGMAFLWEKCRAVLPVRTQVVSYDHHTLLWKAQQDDTRVPRLIIDAQGSVYFSLTRFEAHFDREDMFLLITPVVHEYVNQDIVSQNALEATVAV